MSEIRRFVSLIEKEKIGASDITLEIEKKLEDVERSIACYVRQKEWLESLKESPRLGTCETFSALSSK